MYADGDYITSHFSNSNNHCFQTTLGYICAKVKVLMLKMTGVVIPPSIIVFFPMLLVDSHSLIGRWLLARFNQRDLSLALSILSFQWSVTAENWRAAPKASSLLSVQCILSCYTPIIRHTLPRWTRRNTDQNWCWRDNVSQLQPALTPAPAFKHGEMQKPISVLIPPFLHNCSLSLVWFTLDVLGELRDG